MPEGDTLHKVAARMRPLIAGAVLESVHSRGGREHDDLAGRTIEAVDAIGKHLVITLSGGHRLRTHLGMKGSWHRYAPGEAWQRPAHTASLILTTAAHVLVCFHAAEVELLDPREPATALDRLGPDLLAGELDEAEILARARRPANAARPVGDLLLDQSIAAGIGNVYKSEACYLEKVAPQTAVAALDDDTLARLYRRARAIMLPNLGTGSRITTAGATGRPPPGLGRYWVYRRTGRPCFRCRTAIAAARTGEHARMTYWCPRCQPT